MKDEHKVKELLDHVFVHTMKQREKKEGPFDDSMASSNESKGRNSLFSFKQHNRIGNQVDQPLVDPQQSITILTNAGMEDHALKLAVVYLQHTSYMKIQVVFPRSLCFLFLFFHFSVSSFYHSCILLVWESVTSL
jgi:hypothetical protein